MACSEPKKIESEQAFVKDPDKSVRDILKEASEAAGGDIAVASFVRFALGDSAES